MPNARQAIGTGRGRTVISVHAFTLIELLVVVSIIALLVSILIPALEDARESAKVTLCATRQHQLGIGLLLYANDNRDCSPPPYGYPDDEGISIYVHYPQATNGSWPSWRGLGLLYGPTGVYGAPPGNPQAYKLTGSYLGNVRELVYCPAAGRLRSKVDDPAYGWPENPANIGQPPHGGSVLVNHELRQPNGDGKTTVTELAEKKMAWVFDEMVYLLDFATEAPFKGKGFNVMFPDNHVSWQNIPPPYNYSRLWLNAWLIHNVDARY